MKKFKKTSKIAILQHITLQHITEVEIVICCHGTHEKKLI